VFASVEVEAPVMAGADDDVVVEGSTRELASHMGAAVVYDVDFAAHPYEQDGYAFDADGSAGFL